MKTKNIAPEELTTQRLKLRRLNSADASAIFHGWANDPEVARYVTWSPHKDISVTEAVLSGWLSEYNRPDCIRYGIELLEKGELIGMIDVVAYSEGNPVVGYCLGRKYWKCGYMTEALGAMIKMLFEIGFKTIFIEAVKENIGSIRVVEKCGFVLLGYKQFPLSPEKPEPVLINAYRLDKSKYKKSQRQKVKTGGIIERIKRKFKG